jgi:cytochrome P450
VESIERRGFPPGPEIRRGLIRSLRYYWGFATDPAGFVGRRFESYGDIYYAPNEDGGLFVLRDPVHIHEVLATRASAYGKQHTAFTQLTRVLGEGLLVSEGETWTRHRRMVNPAFASTNLSAYADIMVEEARRTALGWREGEVIALEREMTTLTLRIVSRTLFGHDVSDADIQTIARAMNVFQRSLSDLDFLPRWMPTPARRALERAIDDVDRIVYRLIRDRQRSVSGPSRRDLLQMLVDAVDPEGGSAKLTEREVRDQLVTLFLAGHETTSQALTWAFHCLARTPAAERTLALELANVLGDREPTFADLEQLPYTEQVMLEAMRLYPPVYAIARRAHEDTEVGGWRVPSGSEVIIWVYQTHRHPRLYPDPDTFEPARFEKAKQSSRPKLAYLPFGAGARACIGKAFAMVEARLILATLAQRHRLTLELSKRSVRPRFRITLTPNRSVAMRVTRRPRRAS